MIWSHFNSWLNHNEMADYSVTGSIATVGLTVHFAEFDLILKTFLTVLSIVFVAYRIHSHHEDRKEVKRNRNSPDNSNKLL